jgi:small subunit ribosomal protein S21
MNMMYTDKRPLFRRAALKQRLASSLQSRRRFSLANGSQPCPSAGGNTISRHILAAIGRRIVHTHMPVCQWLERLGIDPGNRSIKEEYRVQVLVRDNNVDQALKVLKKKMQREGVFREMKLHGHYEKPSERRIREKSEAIRRARKLARKKLQREGLLPMKPRVVAGTMGRNGPARPSRF